MTVLKILAAIAGVAALALTLTAQEKKKGGSSAILHPDWKVETGSYDSPAGTLGEKPAQPWSATTIGAAIDGKPQPGKPVTVTGEIIDFSCYLQVGKHGEKHRSCGQKCLQNGQPIGLLAQDGAMYMLMEEEHDPRRDSQTDFRKAAIEHMGHIMQVNGTEASHRGYRAIFVTGFMKK